MSTIDSVLTETRVFQPSAEFVKQANVPGMAAYRALCDEAERDFEGFWARLARETLQWSKPFTRTLDESNAPFYKWFDDGELNVSYNCLDVNLANGNADKIAIIFESDDGTVTRATYRELHARVCRFANGIKALGYKKGDRSIIYMPMSIEAVVAMQACARLGITHSVVFGGFSAKSLQERIVDVGATLVITADEQVRGGKTIPLKPAIEEAFAMGGCDAVKKWWSIAARAARWPGPKGATCGCTMWKRASQIAASPSRSRPSTRCSCSTPRAPPASPKASSTRRRATCCGPR